MQGVSGLFNFGDIYNPRYGESGGQRPNPLPKTTDPSDWECPNEKCKNINFKKRDTCNRCGLKKPKDAQPDPRVARQIAQQEAMSSDSFWNCPACGTRNPPNFQRCEMCNAPKITTERIKSKMEHQGRAGGYFDRQEEVERKEHNSDDDDVDEFGRKKKKAVLPKPRGPAPFRSKKKKAPAASDEMTTTTTGGGTGTTAARPDEQGPQRTASGVTGDAHAVASSSSASARRSRSRSRRREEAD